MNFIKSCQTYKATLSFPAPLFAISTGDQLNILPSPLVAEHNGQTHYLRMSSLLGMGEKKERNKDTGLVGMCKSKQALIEWLEWGVRWKNQSHNLIKVVHLLRSYGYKLPGRVLIFKGHLNEQRC